MSDSTTGGANSRRIADHPILGRDTRENIVQVTINGQTVEAIEGEPIAAAVFANGVASMRSMPESGAPRRYFCGVGRCNDCLMIVDGELSVRTCVTPVRAGMVIETQEGLGTWKAVS
jgi:predicted molibdopterin-dependent oxidoreductase YjgC